MRGQDRLTYLGWRVKCPCCGGRFRKFKELPDRAMTAECPRCRSRPRHRLLLLYLLAETGLESGNLRVLHFAPEAALESPLRAISGEYVSADLDSPRADVKADITRLPFTDAAFDVVLCSHVLEHVPDDAAAMREMRRVLATGACWWCRPPSTTTRRPRSRMYP